MKKIKVKIRMQKLVDIDKLEPFQGSLKKLSDANFNKLRKSILQDGFTFMLHVWENGGVNYIIDGHQRVAVLKQMRKNGDDIPAIPCAFVEAKTYKDAKRLVLLAVSQYGKIDESGFIDFIGDDEFEFDDFDFPDFELPDIYGVDPNADHSEEQPSLDKKTKPTVCPQCGHEF